MDNPLIRYRADRNLSQKAFAERLGIAAPVLCKWETKRIPAERVLEIERRTGISRHELRPDIFGPPPPAPQSGAQAS